MTIEKLPGVGDLSEDELCAIAGLSKDQDYKLDRRPDGGLRLRVPGIERWEWRLNEQHKWIMVLRDQAMGPNLFDVLDELRAYAPRGREQGRSR